MVLKSRDHVLKMSIFKKLSILLYSVAECTLVHVHVHIKKVKSPCCSGGKSVNNCIDARGDMSDRWICSIRRHSRRFSSIEAPSTV